MTTGLRGIILRRKYFYLLKYERFYRVRYVGSPPSSIGKFGLTQILGWPSYREFSVSVLYEPEGKPAP